MPIDMNAVRTEAATKYQESVAKELTKKLTVVTKRQSQIDAYVNAWNKRVKEFNDAIETAATPAEITEVLNAHKFPASSIAFTPRQDD